jgi:glycosyltransferase involved in cell wall biosynthesis
MNQISVSVVVCTYNRAAALEEMLGSLRGQRRIDNLAYEVLVVGDGCTDGTADVVSRFASALPIRFINQPHGGKSSALNTACREALGDLVVFLDDDVVVDDEWLWGFWSASNRRPDVACFQGRVLNHWLCPIPEWLAVEGEFQVRGPIVNGDFGPEETRMQPIRVVGANAAIRREALRAAGEFRTDIGPGHPTAGLNEDTDLALRLHNLGYTGLYVPGATVVHPVPPERATQVYFKRWARACGRSEARVYSDYRTNAELFGMPRYAIRRYIEHRLQQLVFLLRGNRRASFYFKVRSWMTAAVLTEARSWSRR